MAQALSPFAGRHNLATGQNGSDAGTEAANFQRQSKIFQSSPSASDTGHAKEISTQPTAGSNSAEHLEANDIATHAKNTPVQGLASTMAQALSRQNLVAGQNVNGAGGDALGFPSQSKTSKSGLPVSDAGHAKEGNTQPHVGASKADGPENIPVQSPTPMMTQELSSSLELQNMNGIGTEILHFQGQPKTPQSKSSVSGGGQAQTASNQLDAGTNPVEQVGANTTVVDPGNVPIQLGGLNMGMVPAVSAANGAAVMATALAGVKALSTAPAKIPSQKLSQNQPDPAANSTVKSEKPEKITSKDGASAEEMTEAADSKAAGLTPIASQILPMVNDGTTDLKTSKAPVEPTAADSSQSNLSILPDSDAKTPPPTQSIVNGTPAAQQDVSMKSAEKTNKTASPAGNFLPGSVVPVGPGNNLPSRADQITTTGMVNASAQNGPATVTATATDSAVSPSVTNLASQSMERTHDMVTMHALRLGNMSADSLQVVIKPVAGTQLSLELRQRGNGVEAQAVLQQGDFNHLNQRWSDLQQRLEQRGIRLAPLTDDSASANGGGSQTFEQKKNQPAESPADFAFTSPATVTFAQPTARATAQRGWETWA